MMTRLATYLSLPLLLGTLCIARPAAAQVRFVRVEPPNVAIYPVEVELHGAFGADNVYGNTAFGGGARVSIPLVAGWLGRNVADNVALSFGGDILNYDNCYVAGRCGANYLMLPLAAQWNIFFGRHISILGEGGVAFYKGFFDGCPSGATGCNAPADLGVVPTLAVGLRVRVAPYVALVFRLGYPTSTIGVSFL